MSTRLFVSETETVEVEVEAELEDKCDRCQAHLETCTLYIDPRDPGRPTLVYYLCAACREALLGWLSPPVADE